MHRSFALAILVFATPALAQTAPADVETRLRALEARVAALEARAAPQAAAPAANAVACTRLNANGSATGSAMLTVNVNGTDVGTFTGGIYADLEDHMNPGANTIRLTFSGADPMANAELRCLRPGQTSSRTPSCRCGRAPAGSPPRPR
jgi:hypothetical protein